MNACLVVLAACGARAPTTVGVTNRPGEVAPAPALTGLVEVPAPPGLPAIAVVIVEPGKEAVVRTTLCAPDERVLDGVAWAAALTRGGFEAQNATEGWIRNGPMAVRFRDDRLIGDVYANTDAHGCRDYVVRVQSFSVPRRPLRWDSVFGDAPYYKEHFGRCIRFFPHDDRFPFADDEYEWGCQSQ